MLSKAQIKYIRSLSLQKYRKEHKQFIAEGEKVAQEWLQSSDTIDTIIATKEWVEQNTSAISRHKEATLHVVEAYVLSTISSLKTTNKVLLILPLPAENKTFPANEWAIALDGIQDPGNMGSIIRIADWFGIKQVICSPDCVDVYNAKVVQAAMGSHLRVQLFETDLEAYFKELEIPVLAAVLNGKNVYTMPQFERAVLLIGNEGNGISESLIKASDYQVTIPAKGGAESLNAAVSTGILCAFLVPR